MNIKFEKGTVMNFLLKNEIKSRDNIVVFKLLNVVSSEGSYLLVSVDSLTK